MKSLNLTRPLILLIIGNPGSGKSFFARQFSETFNAPVVNFDRIRYEIFSKPLYNAEEATLVGSVANHMIEELLKTTRTFLVDGGYASRADRTRLAQIAKASDYDVLPVWVQTDPATCQSRALRRNPDKRVDDAFSPSLTVEQFELLARRFTEPTREKYVVISGKHTYSAQAKMVLRRLVSDREVVAETAHRREIEQTRQVPRPSAPKRGIIIR